MKKAKGILMCAPMVRATLNDTKTQTRRLIKPQPPFGCAYAINGAGTHALCFMEKYGTQTAEAVWVPPTANSTDHRLHAPYQKGDLLYVKETWKPHCDCNSDGEIDDANPLGTCVKYKADGEMIKPTLWDTNQGFWCEANEMTKRWRTPLFMPRWASRITLEITEVRVQRLQEIGKDGRKAKDVLAEGITEEQIEHWRKWLHPDDAPAHTYGCLWDEINGKGSWAKNEWIFAYTFRRIESQVREQI